MSTDQAASGGGFYFSVLGRYRPGAGDYRLVLRMTSTGAVTAGLTKSVGGAESTVKAAVTTPITYAAGDTLMTRFEVVGSAPTTLRGKVWTQGEAEPAEWTVTARPTRIAGARDAAGVPCGLPLRQRQRGDGPGHLRDRRPAGRAGGAVTAQLSSSGSAASSSAAAASPSAPSGSAGSPSPAGWASPTRPHRPTRASRPRLLVVNPAADLYGSDRMLLEAAAGAVERGWHVDAALGGDGPLADALTQVGVHVHRVRVPVLRKSDLGPAGLLRLAAGTPAALADMRAFVEARRPDVLYVNTVTMPWWLLVARRLRVRSVIHVHEAEAALPAHLQLALTAPLRLADTVVFNSRTSRAVAAAVRGRPEGLADAPVVLNG